MSRTIILALIAVLLASCVPFIPVPTPLEDLPRVPRPEGDFAAGHLIVKFRESVTPKRAGEIVRQHEAQVVSYSPRLNAYYLKIKSGRPTEEIMELLRKLSEVESVSLNYYREPQKK